MSNDRAARISRAAEGDGEALIELLKEHGAGLTAFVSESFPQRFRAQVAIDDVLQGIFADVFLAIRSAHFADTNEFSAWLKTIAGHNIRDLVRWLEADKRGGGRPALGLDPNEATRTLLIDLLASDSSTPSRQLERDEASDLLRRALARLPDDQRRAVQLYDLEGQTIDEAAAALGRTPGGVHVLRCRAHQRLREMLERERTVFRSFL
jgi:RNA polymerase sigma factor (sigma-70 family)